MNDSGKKAMTMEQRKLKNELADHICRGTRSQDVLWIWIAGVSWIFPKAVSCL
jgi:hypothetical protein